MIFFFFLFDFKRRACVSLLQYKQTALVFNGVLHYAVCKLCQGLVIMFLKQEKLWFPSKLLSVRPDEGVSSLGARLWFSSVSGGWRRVMFVALLMTFSTCDPFNKSVPIVHPRLVCADLKAVCVIFIGIQRQEMGEKIYTSNIYCAYCPPHFRYSNPTF